MGLQNLSKILDKYESQLGSLNTEQFDRLNGLPFYDWKSSFVENVVQITSFSFNYAIGLPQKNGQEFPLFDYEQLVFDTLHTHKHVWIKKATGLGITEFMLRYMAWLCFSRNIPRNSQMCIVTGPGIELAITLIDRMKRLFTEARSSQNHAQKIQLRHQRDSDRAKWCAYRSIPITSPRRNARTYRCDIHLPG